MVVTPSDVQMSSPGAGAAVLTFAGEHDLATAATVLDLLDSLLETNELVVADFSQAEFVDSSTLSVLVEAHRLAAEREKVFRLQLGTAAIVKRAFELSGLLQRVSWAPTRQEALAGWTNGKAELSEADHGA